MKRFTIALFLSLLMPAICLGQQSLVGTYKLLSFTYQIDDGPVQQRYEQAPTGYIIVTPKRFMSVIAAGGRKAGQSAADKAALLDSLVAYTEIGRASCRERVCLAV